MGVVGNLMNSAKKSILGNNSSPNQLVEERFIRRPNFQSMYNNNALTDGAHEMEDLNGNGIPDALEVNVPKQKRPKLNPFTFKNPTKDYNQSFDHRTGRYVPTATYPLPPLSYEKKMLDRNKKMRNKQNKFF